MGKFDVLTEPWIPVASVDGQNMELSLTETLLRAHELSQVCCESPLETYAVQRFLIAFLMDAYRLERARDRKRLYEHGHFDKEVLDRYVELCRSEGVSFDLFDEKRPFYQAAFDERYDSEEKIRPAGLLFHAEPRGNTPLHFSHNRLEDFSCSAAEALRALMTAQLFAVSVGSQGYPSSVNDTPCYYSLLRGKDNLFQTLCLGMLSENECGNIGYSDNNAAWRDRRVEIPKNKHADISMLEGLTFRPRRTRLIVDPDGRVRQIYNQPGQDFHANGKWIDPHVPYAINKEGGFVTIKPQIGRAPWRDVGSLLLSSANKNARPSTIIRHSDRVLEKTELRVIMLFGLATSNNARYDDIMCDTLSVPGEILLDEYRSEVLRGGMDKIEEAAKCVYSAVNAIRNAQERTKDGKNRQTETAGEAQAIFFSQMHGVVFGGYMHALAKADAGEPDWEKLPDAILTDAIKTAARQIVRDFANKLGNNARSLEVQVKELALFERKLNKMLNERKAKQE